MTMRAIILIALLLLLAPAKAQNVFPTPAGPTTVLTLNGCLDINGKVVPFGASCAAGVPFNFVPKQYQSAGTFCALGSLGSATGLGTCAGGIPSSATSASICAVGGSINYTDDGATAPTGTVGSGGMPLFQGLCLVEQGAALLANFKMINQSGSIAVATVSWYK